MARLILPPLLNSLPQLTPEFRLLSACAWFDQPNWPTQRSLVLSFLKARIDPEDFHSLVKRHRVPALAYAVLTRALGDAGMPAEWIQRLRTSARNARLRTLALDAEWQGIVKLCLDAAIPIRPLKGTSLSASLYGDVGMRHARDIDLLVAPQDLEPLLDLLHSEGYHVDHGFWPRRRGSALFRISRLLEYHTTCRSPKGFTIEVHSQIERPSSSAMERVWAAHAWNTGPETLARFDLLYCTIHGCMHGWSRLKWLGDLRVMAGRVSENEWPQLIELAKELRLEPLLAGTFLLLDWITGFALPAPAAALVERESRAALHIAHRAIEWMIMPEADLNRATLRNSFRRWQLEWQVERRLPIRDNAPYWLAKLLFSPTDLYTIDLPAPLAILYPLIRPFSTLDRGIGAAISRPR